MTKQPEQHDVQTKSDFEQLREGKQMSIVQEFFLFLAENKKWWLTPIVVTLMLFGVLVVLGGSGAAPFIYTLF
jgi:hypothetical protein